MECIQNKEFQSMSHRAILAPHNINVNEINSKVLNMLNREQNEYTAINYAQTANGSPATENFCTPKYLAILDPIELPPHELILSKNCIVMLIRNLNIKEGLCNGTRLWIVSMQNNLLECKILTEETK